MVFMGEQTCAVLHGCVGTNVFCFYLIYVCTSWVCIGPRLLCEHMCKFLLPVCVLKQIIFCG